MSNNNQPSADNGGLPSGWAELETGGNVELARPLSRLGARIIDWFIQAVPVTVFVIWALATLDLFFGTGSDAPRLLGVLGAIWLFGYEFVQIAVWGKTIGKRIVGIKVIDAAHGGVPGWGKSIGRWIVPFLPAVISILPLGSLLQIIAGLFALLCYISLTWDRGFQGWHDKAVRTLVVRV